MSLTPAPKRLHLSLRARTAFVLPGGGFPRLAAVSSSFTPTCPAVWTTAPSHPLSTPRFCHPYHHSSSLSASVPDSDQPPVPKPPQHSHSLAQQAGKPIQYSNNVASDSNGTVQQNAAQQAQAKRLKPTRKLALPGIIFLIVTYIWSIILIVPMLVAHPFVLVFDKTSRRFHDVIAMAWMRCSLWTVRVRPIVQNAHYIPTNPKQPVVYVANHTSYLDIFVFAYLFRRIKYVSKAEIFKIPIVGWAMQMAGNIALIRASARGQMEAYRAMLRTLAKGISLVVFPEGTRSETGVMRRFKPGAFRAAKQKKALVIPVTILGTREIMPSTAYVPLKYPSDPIQIVLHPPIDTNELEIHEIVDASFRAIDSALPVHVRTFPPENVEEPSGDTQSNGSTSVADAATA